ncbi:uncharacterized protein LOC134181252 isoform X2 [Corticium candelabrum]|uniref:uncharacterized protein LOC134181252 isoform X2 n=1 Tax=Corticium candelabrum TaxID=121492 RepID=UPI002E25E7DA|nr:uncharacterized protein LOC134181252 isoform X2 [Corticium candelabrum]
MSYRMQERNGRRRKVKVILLGEPGVGKTSIFRRLNSDDFVNRPSLTGIMDCLDWDFRDGEKGITLLVTDTGGSDKKCSITPAYYRHARAVILVYAVDREETFHRLQTEWLPYVRYRFDENEFPMLFLVGNKTDLRNNVEADDVTRFCSNVRIPADFQFLMSCKTGKGIQEAFRSIATTLLEAQLSTKDTTDSEAQHVDLADFDHEEPSTSPCSDC